jgi:uncharacterized protein
LNPDLPVNPDAMPTPVARPDEPPAHLKPSLLRRIFVGRDGLRAGWSILLFIGMFAACTYTVHVVVTKFHHPAAHAVKTSEDSIKSSIINEAVVFLVVLLVTWIMSRIERRPNSTYGLGGTRKLANFCAGLVWGVVCLSLLVLVLWKKGFLVIDHRLLFGSDIPRYGALWLIGFLMVGLLEEYLTRGYLQYTLARGLAGLYEWITKTLPNKTRQSEAFGFWTSAILFSILFGLGHSKNPGESPIGLLSAGLAGLVFCISLWRTGSLWWAIGFHTTWDWAQSFLYGVADSGHMSQHRFLDTHPVGKPILSGGATGPEGSIYILGIFVVICIIIFATLPRHRYAAQQSN